MPAFQRARPRRWTVFGDGSADGRIVRLAVVIGLPVRPCLILETGLAVLGFGAERRERVDEPRRRRNEKPRPAFNVENVGGVGDLRDCLAFTGRELAGGWTLRYASDHEQHDPKHHKKPQQHQKDKA